MNISIYLYLKYLSHLISGYRFQKKDDYDFTNLFLLNISILNYNISEEKKPTKLHPKVEITLNLEQFF